MFCLGFRVVGALRRVRHYQSVGKTAVKSKFYIINKTRAMLRSK